MREALTDWVSLDDRQWNQLAAIFQERSVDAKQDILLPHSSVHEIYFVCADLLRFYYLSDRGIETNKAFVAEHTFAGALAALNLDLPVI